MSPADASRAHIPTPEPPQPGTPAEIPPTPPDVPPAIDDPKPPQPSEPVRDPPPDETPNPKRY
jgi:hypothetical protein